MKVTSSVVVPVFSPFNLAFTDAKKTKRLGDSFKMQDPADIETQFKAAKDLAKKDASLQNLMNLARVGVNYYDIKTNLGDQAVLKGDKGKELFQEAIGFFKELATQIRTHAGKETEGNPVALRADYLEFRALSLEVLTSNTPAAVVELVKQSVKLSKIDPKKYDAKETGYPLQVEETDNIRISAVVTAGAVHSRAPHVLAGISRTRGIDWLMSGVVYSRKGVDLGSDRKTLTGDPVTPYLFIVENLLDVKGRSVTSEVKETLAAFNKWNKGNATLNPEKKEFSSVDEAITATMTHIENLLRANAALKYEKPIAQNIFGVFNGLRARLGQEALAPKDLKFFE